MFNSVIIEQGRYFFVLGDVVWQKLTFLFKSILYILNDVVAFMELNNDCSFRISVYGSHCSGFVRLADCIGGFLRLVSLGSCCVNPCSSVCYCGAVLCVGIDGRGFSLIG